MPRPASATAPFFEQSALDVLKRLEGETSAEATSMRIEANELVQIFRSWKVERPDADDRAAAIQRLFSVSRRALDYLLEKPKFRPGG